MPRSGRAATRCGGCALVGVAAVLACGAPADDSDRSAGELTASVADAPERLPSPGTIVAGERDDATAEEERLGSAAVELERALSREATRRDRILGHLARLDQPRGPVERLLATWRVRRARSDLESSVRRLQVLQARLLTNAARRSALAEAREDREWSALEERLERAAAAWEAGGADPATGDTALAAALGGPGGASEPSFARYRLLVRRLAAVNARLSRSAGATVEQRGAADFLGIDDRGEAVAAPGADDASWARLREELAGEIVAVASEVTRRTRGSP